MKGNVKFVPILCALLIALALSAHAAISDDLPYWNGFDFGPNLEYGEEYEIQGDPGEYLNAAEGAKLTFDTMRDNDNVPNYSDDTQYTMTLVDLDDIEGEECYVYRLDVDEPTGTIGAAYAFAYQSGNIYMQGYGGQWLASASVTLENDNSGMNVELMGEGINGFQVSIQDGMRYDWNRDGKYLDEHEAETRLLERDGAVLIVSMVVDPEHESMKGAERGVVFYVEREGNYYFLPFDKKVYEINFNDECDHVNIIWRDDPDNVFEKGYKFPSFEPQGSDNAPTELGAVG
jgi:hypothetical protein